MGVAWGRGECCSTTNTKDEFEEGRQDKESSEAPEPYVLQSWPTLSDWEEGERRRCSCVGRAVCSVQGETGMEAKV